MGMRALLASAILLFGPVAMAVGQTYPSDDAQLFANAKSKEDGKVVWYLNQPLEPLRLVADEFEKQYPGMKVELQRAVGGQLMQRFVRESDAKQNIADLIQVSDPVMMHDLAQANYLAHWKVPTHDRIPQGYRIGDQAYSAIITDMAILYNSDKLKPEEVAILQKSWEGVLDPRFKGRFAVSNSRSGIGYAGLSMFLDPALKDRYGEKFLAKVAQQKPAVYSDGAVAMDRVVAGEQDFYFWFTEGPAVTKWMQGAPLRWIEPSPRPAYPNALQGVSAAAPHPNGARLLQDWLNSEAGARALQDKYGVRTSLQGVPDTRKAAQQPWAPKPQDYEVDLERWANDYDATQNLWGKILKQNR
jgi:iron(III) transport system substrate-binding protein